MNAELPVPQLDIQDGKGATMTARKRQAGQDDVAAPIDPLREALREVRAHLERVASTLKAPQLVSTSRTPEPAEIVSLLEALSSNLNAFADVSRRLAEMQPGWVARANEAALNIQSDLMASVAARGWTIHGQWPTFFVELGVRVHIDVAKGTARVGAARVHPLTVANLMRALDQIVPALFPNGHTSSGFLAAVARAYDALAPDTPESQQSIWMIYRQLLIQLQPDRFWRDARTAGFVEMTADQFRAQFSKALNDSGAMLPDGRVLRLFPPVSDKDALFMYLPFENRFGFVGRVAVAVDSDVSRPK